MQETGSWLNAIYNLEPEWLRAYISKNVLSFWLVAVILLIFFWQCIRRLEVVPKSRWQVVGELYWGYICKICEDFIGKGGARFAPFLGSFFIFILIANLIGLVPGLASPTANLTTTAALGLIAVVSVQYFGFKVQGFRYLAHFGSGAPWWLAWLMFLIHVVGELSHVLSLSVRLFGNIFGEDMVIAAFTSLAAGVLAKIYLPIPLSFPVVILHLLISFIQAMVFTMLTASYIASAVEVHGATEHA